MGGKPGGTIALAEGPETALSIAEAYPDWNVYVTFGVSNFAKVRLPEDTQTVLICADNDGQDSHTANSITRATEKLAQRGIDVSIAVPQKPQDKAKWDFNDALLAGGIEQVKRDLATFALDQSSVKKPAPPSSHEETLAPSDRSHLIAEPASDSSLDLQTNTLETLLLQYVEMELEQTRLVTEMHAARLDDPTLGKALSGQAIAHSQMIEQWAEETVEKPEIKLILEALQKIKPMTLAERGGFSAIRERLRQGEFESEDIHLLTAKLRNKAASVSQTQTRERDRGGRTR